MANPFASRLEELTARPRTPTPAGARAPGRAGRGAAGARALARRLGATLAIRRLGAALVIGAAAFLGGCSGDSGSSPAGSGGNTGNAELVGVRYGRLADVYGYRNSGGTQVVERFRADVVVGVDIQDERPTGSTKPDSEVLYDFIGTDPDTLQQRILIPRPIDSAEFQDAFAGLSNSQRVVSPGVFGQDTGQLPFSVVPRNAAIELEFAEDLGVDESFFLEFGPDGEIIGPRNTEAVQLLQIVGDPNDGSQGDDFRVIPSRVVPRGNRLVIDPVLLGTEGVQYQVRNNASGMPASPDQTGANIRIAVAVEGPLRIPGVFVAPTSPFSGTNNQGDRSVIRDFRSGNSDDNSADIQRGFIIDPEPPRLIGEMLMFIERVDPGNDPATQVVTLYKGERDHEIDRGDVVRFIDPATNLVLDTAEIVQEPEDDIGDPTVQHVRCIVRRVDGLEDIDPSNDPDYPADPRSPTGRAWLRRNASRAVLIAEFTRSRDVAGSTVRDDITNFITFSPTPLPLATGEPSPPTDNVSPFAEAVVRFTKPVDIDTVQAYDSFFFSAKDVLSVDAVARAIEDYIGNIDIDENRLDHDKFVTPHLIASRVLDEDGSQTSIRLQPSRGFYLDEYMRSVYEQFQANGGTPGPDGDPARFDYHVNLVGGQDGIRDLAGNPIDFQDQLQLADEFVTIPFSLDMRKSDSGEPLFADNQVVSIVRRMANEDEDEQPSAYRADEVPTRDSNGNPQPAPIEAFPLADVFGAVAYEDGAMKARSTTRVERYVDDLNQLPPPPQTSELRFCAESVGGEDLVASATASARFGQGIQNPLNPFGSRLQTVWREIDMSLSRTDPFDLNLDVEQMYWAPFQAAEITFDIFDRVSLFLGHSEHRPEPCVGAFSALPELPASGLRSNFADNYAHNLKAGDRTVKTLDPDPHPAYIDQQLTIDSALAFTEPNGINRYLPLPEFQKPYFVWRDEMVEVQGAASGEGSDVRNSSQNMRPYILSPYLAGLGRRVSGTSAAPEFNRTAWGNFSEFLIDDPTRPDQFTGGGVGAIALPLLADFWTYCDDPDLPEGNGFVATGFNGWQIALTVTSAPTPNFRAYSGGFAGSGSLPSICVDTSAVEWSRAAGGYTPNGQRTPNPVDNSLYWIAADFLKRRTVATFGFVDVYNPHRMPVLADIDQERRDPRLGPFMTDLQGSPQLPRGVRPQFDYLFEPPLANNGTAVVPEFRAASKVDPEPWRFSQLRALMAWDPSLAPNEINFPLDPQKAGDAHIQKYDDRPLPSGTPREHWAYYYNRQVTDYTGEITDLADDEFLQAFAGPHETFAVPDLRYFNWRFIMVNNVEANPPVSPEVESFAVTYRFERQ